MSVPDKPLLSSRFSRLCSECLTRRRGWLALLLYLISWAYLPVQFSQGQIYQRLSSGVFLPSNRTDLRGIQQAKALIAKGEYSQAVRFLDEVLARDEDSFVAGSSEEYLGLKEVVRDILHNLPPEGRATYESTFGPVARRLLQQAVESGDFEQLRQITQRYFYTPAGYQAAMLFAQHEVDKGRHLTAALTYQRLLETTEAASQFQPQLSVLAATSWLAAENPSRAAEILTDLAQRGFRDVMVSGRKYSLRDLQQKPLAWLAEVIGTPVIKDLVAEHQWLMPRGNASRNGQADGGLPHFRVRWQVRLLEHHNLEDVHDTMSAVYRRQKKSRLAAATPLAVGDYIITRSAHGLIAVDFHTGKRIWRAQPQQVSLLEDLIQKDRDEKKNYSNGFDPNESFAQMIWEDYLYNTTSSDGQRVYVIRDLTLPKFDARRSLPFGPRSVERQIDAETNRLCAYDLPTQGKLVWEIDGAERTDELQGAFFLGAPVTVGQSLYCLAEIESETAIYLVSLDRQTGALQWRQQLVDLEKGVRFDLVRRMQASMPSYDEGVLVCPTGAGVVVGIDLAKQALAWAYRYENDTQQPPPSRRLQQLHRTMPTNSQWVHSTPVIVDGRVLLTPPESNQLHCLDLVTGKLLWKQPRDKALFLAGVEGERVLLVGSRHMTALNLSDGKAAWEKQSLQLPDAGSPTGSGFFSRGNYFLPLSNAQVIEVDVERGAILASTSSRDGQLLGNLICYRGAVISQTGRFLDCFDQVDVLRAKSEQRRAADPNDFEASRILGEIAYNEGQLPQAIELLSQSYESNPDELRTREVLSEALIAALDEDFASYQDHLPLLQQMHGDSLESQLVLLRLQSEGLLETGRSTEAMQACLEVYEILNDFQTELAARQSHTFDAQRWLAAQVTAIWAAASTDEREEIATELATLQQSAAQASDWTQRKHFYDSFNGLPPTEAVGLKLAEDYQQQDNLLSAQQLLLSLAESEQPEIRRAAIAKSSQLLHEAEMPLLANSFDSLLEGELADQECLPGMTGSECLQLWRSSKESGGLSWPYGKVEVSPPGSVSPRSQPVGFSRGSVQLERCDNVLGSCNIALVNTTSARERQIAIRDSYGREFFRAKLDRQTQGFVNPRSTTYGVARGNLLVVSIGHEIIAFNTMSPEPETLWRKDTTNNLQYRGIGNLANQQRPGTNRPARSQSDGNWLGVLGPVTRDSCIFQVEQRLVCVDSITGQEKWSRGDLPLGCDLYGDEQFVFAMPRGKKHAMIFSAVDGRSLGETPLALPIWREQLTTSGRHVIRWRGRADRKSFELASLDALTGERLWSYDFARGSKVDVLHNRYAAVVEPTGRGVIVDVSDGRLIVDQPLDPSLTLNQIHLLLGTESFVLAVQQNQVFNKSRTIKQLYNKNDFTAPFTGQLYVFDRDTGEPVWSRSADVAGLPLMLSQPGGLPVIAFAGLVRRQNNQSSSKYYMGVKLLEKFTGRLLFEDDGISQSGHLSLRAADASASEMVVDIPGKQVRLKFTDEPRPPEPPALQGVLQKKGDSKKGLEQIGKKLFRDR